MARMSSPHVRRTIAGHGVLPRERPLSRALRALGVAATVVLVATAGVVAYGYHDLASAFAEDAEDLGHPAPPDIAALVDDEGVDLLLTGIDVCEWDSHEKFGKRCPDDRSRYGEDGRELDAGRNDVNLLVHVSPEPRRITAIAFPRDLRIPTPECDDGAGHVTAASTTRLINEQYAAGGLACVARTIDGITESHDPALGIEYAATVTWNGVIEITNAIGGVEVCVDEGIDDAQAGMLHLEPGPHTLAGEQALAFLRSRYGVGDKGDLTRISNQQVYMSALARKLTSEGVLTDPATLLTLARTTLRNVDPSTSLANPVTLVQIGLAVKDVPTSDITFVQYPVIEDPTNRNHVVPDDDAAAAMFRAIADNASLTPVPASPTATDGPEPSDEPAPGSVVAAPGRSADDKSCAQGRGFGG
ncbi:LCP family protein [Microbacterium rhizophilus]|uniref:LCP family protein n=1 Tax=Microbacterium rhizophilus TaxID=3138934 RepID=UPI0031ECA465